MWLPMALLAMLSLFFWFSWNPFDAAGWFLSFIGPHESAHLSWVPAVASAVTFIAICLAYREMRTENPFGVKTAATQPATLNRLSFLRDFSNDHYFIIPFSWITRYLKIFEKHVIDAFIDLIAKGSVVLGHLIGWFDKVFVDGGVNLTVFSIRSAGQAARSLQNGKIQSYYIVTAMGVFLLILWLVAM
jgi:NADH-quinone oxidoreductase subunit L